MKNLRELIEVYGEKEITLKILKSSLSRRKKWELINSGFIFSIFNDFNFSKEKRELEEYEKEGIKILSFFNYNYPEELKNIPDPPIALFYKGNFDNSKICVSIVGTRKCSSYGKRVAEEIGEILSNNGIVVVSGLANGIDSSAHIGALKGSGLTFAVLGSGINHIYPKNNLFLSKKIEERGALISEYLPDTLPRDYQFPERNRIIAGLSKVVVLVEAPEKSGSLITANFACEYGREVFCVPGPIHSPLSYGCHKMIRDGANILTSYDDLLEFLNVKKEIKSLPTLTKDEEELLNRIPFTVTYVDDIITSPKDLTTLISLESKGLIESFPGNYYIRKIWK